MQVAVQISFDPATTLRSVLRHCSNALTWLTLYKCALLLAFYSAFLLTRKFQDSTCALCGTLQTKSCSPVNEPLSEGVRTFLLNNDAPADSDRRALGDLRRSVFEEITEIDLKIGAVRQALQDLIEEKKGAETKYAALSTILNPIRILPAELVHEIMLFALAPSLQILTTPSISMQRFTTCVQPEFPTWTVSQICRSWRRCAIDYPELWSNIVLNFRIPEYQRLRSLIFKLGQVIERSKDTDLSVLIIAPIHHPVLGLLETSAARWRFLRMWTTTTVIQSFEAQSFPRLQILNIFPIQEEHPQPAEVFRDACPRLEAMTFFYRFADSVHLPWSGLKSLTLNSIPFPTRSNIDILNRMTSLESMTLRVSTDMPRATPFPNRVSFCRACTCSISTQH